MRFSPDNFLYTIKQLVTGANKSANTASGTAQAADGGIQKDNWIPLEAVSANPNFPVITNNTAGTASTTFAALTGTYATDVATLRNIISQIALELNALNGQFVDTGAIPVILVPAGTNSSIGIVSVPIPRDYDEATDSFHIRLFMSLSNAADTGITVTGTPTVQPIGGSPTTGTAVTGTAPFSTVSEVLTTTEAVVDIDLSGLGLQRDGVIAVALALAGTTSYVVNVYAIEYKYDSCIVSFNDTDATGIDGSLAEYGNPLR